MWAQRRPGLPRRVRMLGVDEHRWAHTGHADGQGDVNALGLRGMIIGWIR